MFKRLALFVTLTVISGASIVSAAGLTVNSWPASSDAVAIDSTLDSMLPGNEPSGLAWHSGRNQLLGVGDEGQLFAMNTDGSNLTVWQVGGDLEDVAVVDPSSSYVYVANEDGYIIKYNLSTSSTVQSWDVRNWMPEKDCDGDPSTTSTCGMEALTYANGYFYAGYQYNGKIYVFDLSGNAASLVSTWNALSDYGYTSFSGLHYRDNYLYALYRNTMGVLDLNGNVLTAYAVPGSNPEGLALGNDSNNDGDADMFIAQDSSGVYAYDNFPIYGWTAPVTCTPSTYYLDTDGDGLGSDTAGSYCSTEVPSNYVSNSNDTNDSIPNAGVEISADGVDNDGDGKTDEHNTVALNGYHPYYSTLDANVNSVGKITGYWGLKNGEVGIKYADGSVYRYQPFTGTTSSVTGLVSIYGTAYFTVTLNGTTVYMNGYTGAVESYTPNSRVEISRDGVDNDLDGLIDEHSTLLSNGVHPTYGSLDPNSSSKGNIIGYWGLKNGEIGVRYADWSVYRYQAFNVRSGTTTSITLVSGTAYFTVTLNGESVTLNGYNGELR